MSVYVDDFGAQFGRMRMCHMVADTEEELHAMADQVGLKRDWYQGDASTPHYDVSLSKRALAIKLGARPVTRRELVRWIKERRAKLLAAPCALCERLTSPGTDG